MFQKESSGLHIELKAILGYRVKGNGRPREVFVCLLFRVRVLQHCTLGKIILQREKPMISLASKEQDPWMVQRCAQVEDLACDGRTHICTGKPVCIRNRQTDRLRRCGKLGFPESRL